LPTVDPYVDNLAEMGDLLSTVLQDIAPEGVEIVNSDVEGRSGVKISELTGGLKVLVQAAPGEALTLREFLVVSATWCYLE
jgi:hypothetical protein